MKALFLHLSDFHFHHDTDALLARVSRIAAAIGSVDTIADVCVVVATGDIAFSGKEAEYNIADRFFKALRTDLTDRYGKGNVAFSFVPGNHDCDFSRENEPRKLALQNLPRKITEIQQDDATFSALVEPQTAFFQFVSKWMNQCDAHPWVFCKRTDTLSNIRVCVRCYNTAFSSQLTEEQGKLYFPLHLVGPNGLPEKHDSITISLLHHPYPWLESNNGIALKGHIEAVADFVLTGHQHSESIYSKRNIDGEEINYFEGAALRGNVEDDSGFNVVVCDLAESKFRRMEFRWSGNAYNPIRSHDWLPFTRNRRVGERFEINAEYRSYLNDPGTGFTHPRTPKLLLHDIFVYPDFTTFSFERRIEGRDTPELLPSSKVKEFLLSEKRVFMSGQACAGKTSLAKTLYCELTKLGFVPVAMSAADLKSISENKLIGLVNNTFVSQYDQSQLEQFKQLGRDRKVLLLDEWHKTKLTLGGRAIVSEMLAKLFDRIYIFSGEGFRIEEISHYRESSNPLREFELCEFREFGHVLRAKLIEKWYCIGRDFTWDVNEHAREVDDTERRVATLLGKNLIPSIPETILSILQAIEAHKTPSTPSGSYGYLYEALLTSALANVCKDSSELDLMYTFIARLAFYLFDTEHKCLSREDVEKISEEYFSEYSIPLNLSDLLLRLEIAQVVSRASGNYSFRYKYVYYYFVARYFQEALRDTSKSAEAKTRLYAMADRVYYEEYSGIVMFVLYLTKDVDFIRHIIRNADGIYSNVDPCDFDTHVEFVNRLYKEPPKVLVPSTDLAKNREDHRKSLDDAREQALQLENEKLAYGEELSDIIKINIAFKTLHLLGQTLKNFPGSLQKEIKIEMAQSCYFLGLRLARAILRIAENNLEDFRSYFAEIIREHRSSLTEGELAKTTDEAVIWLTRRSTFAVVKRVSYSVGLELLQETYKAVLERSSNQVPVRLIDLSVKLDHFSAFPEREVAKLWDDLRKNNFSGTLVRDMVAHHIYLFGLAEQTLQKVGATLDIKVSDPRFHNPQAKKLRS